MSATRNTCTLQGSEVSRKRRVGYLGHVYKIAVTIQDVVSNKENRKFFVEWLETQHDPNFWNTFYEETLKVRWIRCEQLWRRRGSINLWDGYFLVFFESNSRTTLQDQRDKNNSELGPDPRRYNHMDSDDDNEEKIGIGLKNLVNNPLFSVSPHPTFNSFLGLFLSNSMLIAWNYWFHFLGLFVPQWTFF